MHSWTFRANSLLFYAFSGVCIMAAAAALSSLWLGGEPIIRDFRVARVDKFTSDAHAKRLNPAIRAPQGEIAALRTTLHADFRPVFHWNVKQLFVFIVAQYKTNDNSTSEVTIFDLIVKNKEMANLELTSVGKYFIVEELEKLKGNDIDVLLKWDIMPVTGSLYLGSSTSDLTITLPKEYCFDVQCNWEEKASIATAPS